jgi:hypothetical protein
MKPDAPAGARRGRLRPKAGPRPRAALLARLRRAVSTVIVGVLPRSKRGRAANDS